MPKIPRVPHEKVKEPNTDLQEAVINAVEEHYPDLQLKEIAELDEVDCDQSTVSRVVNEFMKPVREEEPEEEPTLEMPTLTLNIDEEDVSAECIRYYVKGKSEGFEEGFDAALEWVENSRDLPEGTIQRGRNPK